MLQVSTPALMEQVAAAVPPLTLQLRPELLGRVSVTVTPWAVPAPLLLTVSVKPMVSPASTGLASAVLRMWMAAQLTVIEADELSLPSLLVLTPAVLGTKPQLAAVVGELR